MCRIEIWSRFISIGLVLLSALTLISCGPDGHEDYVSILCQEPTELRFTYNHDAHVAAIDSLATHTLQEIPPSVLTEWTDEIVQGWFADDRMKWFWGTSDSLLQIGRVLLSLEFASLDGPSYRCVALVCTNNGLEVVGHTTVRAGLEHLIIAEPVKADEARTQWMASILQEIVDGAYAIDASMIKPHDYGILVVRAEINDRSEMMLTNIPHRPAQTGLDSLFYYLHEELYRDREE